MLGSVELVDFRCRHQSPEAIIGWLVNGSSVGQFPDITIGSVTEDGTKVYTLTIPARSEYNKTTVVCVALFVNGSPPESTPPTTLMFHTGLSKCTYRIIIASYNASCIIIINSMLNAQNAGYDRWSFACSMLAFTHTCMSREHPPAIIYSGAPL